MAATERVVVLMTPQQKSAVAKRARAERLSLSEYMRRQALGDDELLVGLLAELRASTAQAAHALDRAISRLERMEAARFERDEQTRRGALAEFKDIDPERFAQLVGAQQAGGRSKQRPTPRKAR